MIRHDTDLSHPTHAYALDVVEGRIVAGPIVRAACKRHLDDLKDAPARGFVFSARKADHAINFFPVVLSLDPPKDEDSDGEPTPFHLGAPQKFIIGSLFGWIESNTINDKCSGYRRFRTAYVEQGKGNGKALALDTLIPTPDGWVKMGDIKVGDRVFGADGKPCRVIVAHPISLDRDCYRIAFDDGDAIVASAEHLWVTFDASARQAVANAGIKNYPRHWTTWKSARGKCANLVTTAGISRTIDARPGSKNHSIPLAGSLQLSVENLIVDPFVLGVWLGDGSSSSGSARIAADHVNGDQSLIRKEFHIRGYATSDISDPVQFGVLGLLRKLSEIGVVGNKHVPHQYLRASIEQRLDLLRGLMLTDGTITEAGQVAFENTNERLIDAVVELARTLGQSPRKSSLSRKTCAGKPVWRVCWSPTIDVFGLGRKSSRMRLDGAQSIRHHDRKIVACDKMETVPVRCITVDSPDGMFLAGWSMIPTHNSPVAAGIGMYGLIADGEHRAEIFSAAAKKDQAMIMFKDAVSFVEMSPPLSKRLKLSGKQPNVWNIYDEQTNSNFRPISSDEGQSGARPHIGLIDELHEHKSPLVVNMMGAGQKGRKQPLVFIITNSGSDKQTVCGEYHDKAERVAFGMEQDDRFFSYVCSLDKDDDPFVDEECWIKANPMLGITIQKQYIRDQIAAATMPSKQSDVKRLNFCIWTAADNPFIDYGAWNGALNKFDLSMFANHDDVALGLDLSQVRDLTAAVFSRKIKGHIYWWPEFWIPEAMVHEKTVEDKVPYETWVARGWVRTTPGNTISLSHVANDIKELMKTHRIGIQSAPYDRWRIDDFKKACDSVDLRIKDQLQEFGQGFKDMSPAIDAFERDLMNGYFHHPGNPCLDWCAANAVVISDPAGGRKLDKGSNQRKRIDGIIAGIMSHHATSLLPEQSIPSIRWM